jgi:hypothetical protein
VTKPFTAPRRWLLTSRAMSSAVADRLGAALAEHDRELRDEAGPPRLFLLEVEYVRAVTAAELEWVERVAEDLRAGELTWSHEELAEIARHFTPPD